jgi:hypothetical protein
MISHFDNFSFINENETTIPILSPTGDVLAIQLEYEFTPVDTTIHTFTVFTTNNDDGDSFYQFIFYADPETFPNYISDFKKIFDAIEFTTKKES